MIQKGFFIGFSKKLTEKENWYKLKRKQQIEKQKKGQVINKIDKQVPVPVVSVMFVPYTPNSQLIQKLKKVEAKVSQLTNDKIQHVERAGTKLMNEVGDTNP